MKGGLQKTHTPLTETEIASNRKPKIVLSAQNHKKHVKIALIIKKLNDPFVDQKDNDLSYYINVVELNADLLILTQAKASPNWPK
jgi:hypothetical protein